MLSIAVRMVLCVLSSTTTLSSTTSFVTSIAFSSPFSDRRLLLRWWARFIAAGWAFRALGGVSWGIFLLYLRWFVTSALVFTYFNFSAPTAVLALALVHWRQLLLLNLTLGKHFSLFYSLFRQQICLAPCLLSISLSFFVALVDSINHRTVFSNQIVKYSWRVSIFN